MMRIFGMTAANLKAYLEAGFITYQSAFHILRRCGWSDRQAETFLNA